MENPANQCANCELPSIIKYEGGNDMLIWKHPVEDFAPGSQLIVHECQEAILFRDGKALDLYGSGRYTLESQQIPSDDDIALHSEVYFINTSTVMGIKWGTDAKVHLFDPATGLHVALGACGEFNIRVVNSRKLLLKLVGTSSGLTQQDIMGADSGMFRGLIMTQVKCFLAATIKEKGIPVLELDEHLMELSDALCRRINDFLGDYGLEITEFYVSRIATPDEDPNFRKMKEQYAQRYLDVREEEIRKDVAEAAARRKIVEAQTDADILRIQAQAEADALKLKAEGWDCSCGRKNVISNFCPDCGQKRT